MNTGSMIVEVVVITMVIALPLVALALSYWAKSLEKSGKPQNNASKIGMFCLEALEVSLEAFAKVLSFLLTGEWSYVNEIVSTAEPEEAKEK